MPSERVLIIEDNKQMLSFLTDKALPALGYQPIIAETGYKGLRLVESEAPDLILLDLNLPDMNGIEVLRRLSAADSQIPVILMTAYGTEQVVLEAFRMGVRDYLPKPLELGELADSLKRALETPRLQRDKRRLAEDLHRTTLQLRQQIDQIATFTHVGRAVTASLNLDSILTQVIEAATQLCNAEEATVWLLEGSSKDLVMVAETGMDDEAIRLQRLSTMRVQDALAGEAVRTRKPIQAADQQSGIKVKTGYLVKAVMYVPMLIQDSCLGVVSVANRRSFHPFGQSDLRSLQILADYAAIAIEKARLYRATDDALQRRTGELAAITEISEGVATLDFEILLRRAIDRIHQTFHVEAAALFLVDDSQESLRLAHCSDQTVSKTDLRVPFGKGLVGSCAKDSVSYLTNDPRNHALFSPKVDQFLGRPVNSLLAVPLAIEGRLIGVVELVNKRTSPFHEEDASLLRAMAMPVAAAVDNLQLFGQIVRERATLHAVVNGSTNPILIVNHAHDLLICNPAATMLFGIPAGAAMGLSLAEATDLPRLTELVDQQRAVSEEVRFKKHTYITNVSPIDGVGSAIEMQDITYLKELDKAKSDFVTMVSHDLRSPLTSIVGFTELLPAAGPLNEKQLEFVQFAMEATKNMRRLIDDLLDLAKIESGLIAAHVPCDMNQIASEVVSDSQGIAVSQGIQLSLASAGESATVMGDPSHLGRALANLVGNALKYTPAGGQVRVGLRSSEDTLYVAVVDTGRGIPERDLPHIFEKFYRVEKHREMEGTGLGLAMVKSIIRAHHGTVSVRSQEDKGSTFTIALPLT
jgi:signal transduction histidine kinase/DNA-binding response OmpR family regulator